MSAGKRSSSREVCPLATTTDFLKSWAQTTLGASLGKSGKIVSGFSVSGPKMFTTLGSLICDSAFASLRSYGGYLGSILRANAPFSDVTTRRGGAQGFDRIDPNHTRKASRGSQRKARAWD